MTMAEATLAMDEAMDAARGTSTDGWPDEAAWGAVAARDRAADGAFVYAVRTTGIYCRPSCPSRRPRREHVAFYDAADAAERAGYRACRRCHPREARREGHDAVRRARALLDAHADADPGAAPMPLGELAARVGAGAAHLQRTFTREVGLSPRAYQDARRLAALRERLRAGDTVSRATFEAGFGSSRGVYERARDAFGMTPGALRRGGAGEAIAWTVRRCALGQVLVAATARGVCAVSMADDEGALEEELRAEFPRATLVRDGDHPSLAAWADAVARALDGAAGDAAALDVPLDLRGSDFQLLVWRALRAIPAGETRSYAALAAAIGRPSAARAVARACATNRVAVVVPCHRVVREGGAISGYRWGVARKAALLERERRQPGG